MCVAQTLRSQAVVSQIFLAELMQRRSMAFIVELDQCFASLQSQWRHRSLALDEKSKRPRDMLLRFSGGVCCLPCHLTVTLDWWLSAMHKMHELAVGRVPEVWLDLQRPRLGRTSLGWARLG